MEAWESTHPAPATHWCPLCADIVTPLWMLVPNTAEIIAYHLYGTARHAVTGHTPTADPRETITAVDGTLTTTEPV